MIDCKIVDKVYENNKLKYYKLGVSSFMFSTVVLSNENQTR